MQIYAFYCSPLKRGMKIYFITETFIFQLKKAFDIIYTEKILSKNRLILIQCAYLQDILCINLFKVVMIWPIMLILFTL